MLTKAYVESNAKALVRDYNAYRKMKNMAACKDYKTALDNLILVAGKQGIKVRYMITSDGYIQLI